MLLALIGYRTYIFSGLALLFTMVITGSAEGVFELAPFTLMICKMGLAAVLPLIPIFMRKAIEDMKK